MLGCECLDALDNRRIVECVGEIVAGEGFCRGQGEFEVDEQRLGQMLLPGVDADPRVDAQFLHKDGIHRRAIGSVGLLESSALAAAERAL